MFLILWIILSLLIFLQYLEIFKELNETEKIIVCVIFLIGGPIFAAANVLEAILNLILPEGWSDE